MFPVSTTDYVSFCSQFQKQGRDVEKVKQRLAEIANYVDKVKHPLPLCTGGINHFFKIEILLAAEINGMTVWYINVLLKTAAFSLSKPSARAVDLQLADIIGRWIYLRQA